MFHCLVIRSWYIAVIYDLASEIILQIQLHKDGDHFAISSKTAANLCAQLFKQVSLSLGFVFPLLPLIIPACEYSAPLAQDIICLAHCHAFAFYSTHYCGDANDQNYGIAELNEKAIFCTLHRVGNSQNCNSGLQSSECTNTETNSGNRN